MSIEALKNITTPRQYKALQEVVSKSTYINFKFAISLLDIEATNLIALFVDMQREMGI